MLKPYYTAAAIEDPEEILTFIAKDKPGASLNWVEKIEAKCLLIAAAPDIGDQMPNLGQKALTPKRTQGCFSLWRLSHWYILNL